MTSMNKYELKTYCLNVTPHRETCEIVYAQTAVDAIRTVPLWRGAIGFVVDTETNGEVNAHTQDGNGCNGAHAKRID